MLILLHLMGHGRSHKLLLLVLLLVLVLRLHVTLCSHRLLHRRTLLLLLLALHAKLLGLLRKTPGTSRLSWIFPTGRIHFFTSNPLFPPSFCYSCSFSVFLTTV
jgi:hypothetical protein